MTRFQTHVVENQPPDFAPRDLWADDVALREAIDREGGGAHVDRLACYGALAGSELYALSFDAHRDKPRLRTHDRFGHRIDVVEFHPSYHRIIDAAIGHGVAGLSWAGQVSGAHVARAALSYLHHQVEPGTSCPLTMTHAAVPVLRHVPALREWVEKVASSSYDPRDMPIADKAGVTIGMGMTEKQGGSDVRSNMTTATPLATGDTASGQEYALVGHKWFFSAPMSDGFLVLAQAPGGLTCFLLPRRLADGRKNAFALMRLKDKLGDWSNASAEVEFMDARATRIGDEGRGVATILEMVMLTRLDCMLGSVAEMRMALAQALHHTAHRRAFGKALLEQLLMRNVLADLAIEWEAALALSMRVARAVDAMPRDPHEAALARVATAIGKYWICKRTPAFVNEASILPRLYRQAPLNSIWEGSGNIQCLDVLRALTREPESGAALMAELGAATGMHTGYDACFAALKAALVPQQLEEAGARLLVERLALALQASILLRAQSPVADAFCRSRLGGQHGLALGTLPTDLDFGALIERVLPV